MTPTEFVVERIEDDEAAANEDDSAIGLRLLTYCATMRRLVAMCAPMPGDDLQDESDWRAEVMAEMATAWAHHPDYRSVA